MTTGLNSDQVSQYLSRIGLAAPLPSTAVSLATIQWAHLQTVPFEALDISPLDTRFSLDLEDVYRKVVIARRGGFCFELNSLLAALLESLGYQVDRMSAYFTDDPESDHAPFDHMPLNVTVPDDGSRWFVDVAAGRQNPPRPVPLNGISADGQFRTRLEDALWHFEKLDVRGDWLPQLAWGADVRRLGDFQDRCTFFQEDSASPFRMGPLCTRMTPEGRVTLSKWTLITTANGIRTERNLESEGEIRTVLKNEFGIEIDFSTWWRERQP